MDGELFHPCEVRADVPAKRQLLCHKLACACHCGSSGRSGKQPQSPAEDVAPVSAPRSTAPRFKWDQCVFADTDSLLLEPIGFEYTCALPLRPAAAPSSIAASSPTAATARPQSCEGPPLLVPPVTDLLPLLTSFFVARLPAFCASRHYRLYESNSDDGSPRLLVDTRTEGRCQCKARGDLAVLCPLPPRIASQTQLFYHKQCLALDRGGSATSTASAGSAPASSSGAGRWSACFSSAGAGVQFRRPLCTTCQWFSLHLSVRARDRVPPAPRAVLRPQGICRLRSVCDAQDSQGTPPPQLQRGSAEDAGSPAPASPLRCAPDSAPLASPPPSRASLSASTSGR